MCPLVAYLFLFCYERDLIKSLTKEKWYDKVDAFNSTSRVKTPVKAYSYNPPALLLPNVLVNIIVVVVYFYPRLRIRYPEFILVVIIVDSEARYKTLHSTSHSKVSEWVGVVDTASSYEPECRGFESHLFFFLHTFFVPLSGYCLIVQDNLET